MYTLRDDSTTQTIRLQLAGKVSAGEAARALSQTFAFAEAAGRTKLVCDLTAVRRGPEELETIAALIKLRPVSLRLAFVGSAAQLKAAVALVEMAGIARWSGAFAKPADAEMWLCQATERRALPGTAGRHLRQNPPEAPSRGRTAKRAEPAA